MAINTNTVEQINFSLGGYQGDTIEETFKGYTTAHMPFWWQFREVLRASLFTSAFWKKQDGSALSDAEYKELVGISLLNYAVHNGIVEALGFFNEMMTALTTAIPPSKRLFEVRKSWKALYSSLYSSHNALCNIVYVLIKHESVLGDNPNEPFNYTPRKTIGMLNGHNLPSLSKPLNQCEQNLELRHHLDHYWTVWVYINQGIFRYDSNFSKGYLPIRPSEVSTNVDACKQAMEHIDDIADNFGIVYRELAISGGWFDKYLIAKGWQIDYSDYGAPHHGKRPQP